MHQNALFRRENRGFYLLLGVFLLCMTVVFLLSGGYGNNAFYADPGRLFYPEPDNRDAYMMQTDALLKGQLHLDITPSKELLALENPYDPHQREGVEYVWDFAFYKGQYYSYFGVVPVVLLLLPIRLITGQFLSTYWAAFFLGLAAAAALAFLYRKLVFRFAPNASKKTVLCTLAALLFGSNLLFLCARSWFYEIPYQSGLLLVFLSLIALLKAKESGKNTPLFFAGLTAALAVGCRPVYLLCFLLHLPFLFPYLKQPKRTVFMKIAVYGAPILTVGMLLGIYNLLRFDSFTQFGAVYQLTVSDIRENRIFDLPKQAEGFLRYLLQPIGLREEFPFLALSELEFTSAANGMYSHPVVGLLQYPVVWGLFFPIFLWKAEKNTPLWRGFWAAGLLTLFATLALVIGTAGIMERYTLDFQWLAMLLGLLSLLRISEREKKPAIEYLLILCSGVTVLFGLCIGSMGEFSRMLVHLNTLFL